MKACAVAVACLGSMSAEAAPDTTRHGFFRDSVGISDDASVLLIAPGGIKDALADKLQTLLDADEELGFSGYVSPRSTMNGSGSWGEGVVGQYYLGRLHHNDTNEFIETVATHDVVLYLPRDLAAMFGEVYFDNVRALAQVVEKTGPVRIPFVLAMPWLTRLALAQNDLNNPNVIDIATDYPDYVFDVPARRTYRLADEFNAYVAPVGLVWRAVREADGLGPADLYSGQQADDLSLEIAAVTLFYALVGRTPILDPSDTLPGFSAENIGFASDLLDEVWSAQQTTPRYTLYPQVAHGLSAHRLTDELSVPYPNSDPGFTINMKSYGFSNSIGLYPSRLDPLLRNHFTAFQGSHVKKQSPSEADANGLGAEIEIGASVEYPGYNLYNYCQQLNAKHNLQSFNRMCLTSVRPSDFGQYLKDIGNEPNLDKKSAGFFTLQRINNFYTRTAGLAGFDERFFASPIAGLWGRFIDERRFHYTLNRNAQPLFIDLQADWVHPSATMYQALAVSFFTMLTGADPRPQVTANSSLSNAKLVDHFAFAQAYRTVKELTTLRRDRGIDPASGFVKNGSFEVGQSVPWFTVGADIDAKDANSYEGAYSAEVKNRGGPFKGVKQLLALDNNTTYSFRVAARTASNADPDTFKIRLAHTVSGEMIFQVVADSQIDADWQVFTGEFTTDFPGYLSESRLEFITDRAEDYFIDDVQIWPVAGESGLPAFVDTQLTLLADQQQWSAEVVRDGGSDGYLLTQYQLAPKNNSLDVAPITGALFWEDGDNSSRSIPISPLISLLYPGVSDFEIKLVELEGKYVPLDAPDVEMPLSVVLPDVVGASAQEPVLDTDPNSMEDPTGENEPGAQADPDPEPVPGLEAEPKPELEAEPKPEIAANPEPDMDAEANEEGQLDSSGLTVTSTSCSQVGGLPGWCVVLSLVSMLRRRKVFSKARSRS